MLVEMAIGDAYGAAFEFIPPAEWSERGLVNDCRTYQKHPELPIGDGRYTDDTQMSAAIVESMLSGEEMTREGLAQRFVEVFKRDPRQGYGKRFYQLLLQAETGDDLLRLINPTSTRSGAAMRAGPIGLYGDIQRVLDLAALQASVTHDTLEGRMAAQAVACMTHYVVHTHGALADVGLFIQKHVPGYPWNDNWTTWASVEALPCAHAAITAVKCGTSPSDVLRRSVAVGGDVDTVAAIAMFPASYAFDENDLSPYLYKNLENGAYGHEYLHQLDLKLFPMMRKEIIRSTKNS